MSAPAPASPPTTYSGPPDSSEYEALLPDSEATMGREEQQLSKPEGRKGDTFAKYAALISMLVFLITTWIVILSNDPKSLGWFPFHPLLQSLSLALFTYGILTLQPTSQPQTKEAGLARHQVAMLLGFPAIASGTSFMIYNKHTHDAPHFTSWHGVHSIVHLTAQILTHTDETEVWPRCNNLDCIPDQRRIGDGLVRRSCIRWRGQSKGSLQVSSAVRLRIIAVASGHGASCGSVVRMDG